MGKKRKRQIRNINSELPSSIFEVIFSKLHSFNLPNCRLVCKEWNDLILACKFDSPISISGLISDRIFRNLVCAEFDPNPLKRMGTVASFNFHPKLSSKGRSISIVNSCHGLLCLRINKFRGKFVTPRSVCILNPMTNEYLKLPISKSSRRECYRYGLGFSPKTKQYKIARASMIFSHILAYGTLIEIFAFGTSREWITVGFLPFHLNFDNFVYSNGGLYLVRNFEGCAIYRLDVEDEIIREFSPPSDQGKSYHIVDLNDTLYLTIRVNDHLFHGWKMKEDFSWIKAFVFPIPSKNQFHSFTLIKAYEDGKILCNYGDYDLDLILYDPKSETKEILVCRDGKIKRMTSFHQIGSSNFNSLPKILAGNG